MKTSYKEFVDENFTPNTSLNKKVLKFVDDYVADDYKEGSPEYQWVLMHLTKGALTDANFHTEATQINSIFSRAKNPFSKQTDMEDIVQGKASKVATWARWDGYDILQAFAFVTSMRVGRPVGEKLEALANSMSFTN